MKALKELRKEKNILQKDVAKELNIKYDKQCNGGKNNDREGTKVF